MRDGRGEPSVREESPGDIPAIRGVLEAAFGRPGEAELVEALRRGGGLVLSLVAEGGGAVVGHIAFSLIRIEAPGRSWPALALAPVGVVPPWQGRGVGGLLIRAGLALAAERGAGAVVVLGHPGYYPRFGFVPASRFGIRAPFPVPDAAFLAQPLRPGALEGVAGTVWYRPEFAAVE
jgi:putative acetyltransferase